MAITTCLSITTLNGLTAPIKIHRVAEQVKHKTQMSINRGLDKEDVVYLYNGALFGHKKE